jgi:hypothetical protein
MFAFFFSSPSLLGFLHPIILRTWFSSGLHSLWLDMDDTPRQANQLSKNAAIQQAGDLITVAPNVKASKLQTYPNAAACQFQRVEEFLKLELDFLYDKISKIKETTGSQ